MRHSKLRTSLFFMLMIGAASIFCFVEATHAGTRPSVRKGHDFTKIPPGAKYKPGELLVRFTPKQNGLQRGKVEKKQVLNSLGGGTVEREFKMVPGLSLIKLSPGLTVEQALKTFNNRGEIFYAEPNYKMKAESAEPNDPNYSDLWGMRIIDANDAWDIHNDANHPNEVIVAVIDTGVDYEHEDLSGNMWVNIDEFNGDPNVDDDENGYVDDIYGYDFCDNDSDPNDENGHGTHCAGTIGAVGNNNEGVAGVCWKVKIMAVRWLNSGGGGDTSDCIEALEYSVDMGARISSNSYGDAYSQSLKDEIEAAGDAGCLFVASAGNNGNDNDQNPHYPSDYNCQNIISVMATDQNDTRADWGGGSSSNYGACTVDLAAPGSDILSCKLGGGYQLLGGTSMAAPHVAGACALLWSKEPQLSYLDVKYDLLDTVDKIEALDGLCISNGRLNVYNALLGPDKQFIIKNSDENIARFGSSFGDLLLKGTLEESSSHTATSNDEFRIQDSNSSDIAIIDANDGNMYIDGTVSESQSTLTPSASESNFVIKDSNDDVIAYIDESGDMFLKGKLYEQSSP